MKIEVVIGDIARQPDVEAVVNSANRNLRLGSGVAGAIHTAAGPELEAYCRPFAPLALGHAIATPAFGLPNRWIIHVRAPHFLNDDHPETHDRHAMASMMEVIQHLGIESVAIPAIGTGVFRTPPELAAELMAEALCTAASPARLQRVRICVAHPEFKAIYAQALGRRGNLPV